MKAGYVLLCAGPEVVGSIRKLNILFVLKYLLLKLFSPIRDMNWMKCAYIYIYRSHTEFINERTFTNNSNLKLILNKYKTEKLKTSVFLGYLF